MNEDANSNPAAAVASENPQSDKDTKPKKLRNKHISPEILEVRRKIQHCCKTNDLETALSAYNEAVSKEIKIEAQSFYSLLNLCDGMETRKIHIGTPKSTNQTEDAAINVPNKPPNADKKIKDIDVETRKRSAFQIREHMRKENIALNETSFTALIKILARANDVALAESIIKEAEGVQQCRVKLRLYSPLISAYCKMGELLPALRIWERLSKHDLTLTEKEYANFIRCCAACGDASVMQKVFSDLSEDVLVPSKVTCRAVIQWFQSPFSRSCPENDPDAGNSAQSTVLDKVNLPIQPGSSMIGRVQCSTGWDISQVCRVEPSTGVLLEGCLKGAQLQPVTVSPCTWQEMIRMNEEIVLSGKLDGDMSRFQGGRKGKKRKLGDNDREGRTKMWESFKEYLKKHENKFDVVIDGANVGFYEMNFAGATKHVNYHQIDWVVRHFLRAGKRVLLILHRRHFAHNLMPRNMEHIVKGWDDSGVLYRTPAGMNDDWFWLHAALISGPGTLVVTNDEMRDHHFQMLAPRSFLRWKDRHQVHFGFGGNNRDHTGQNLGRVVELTYPELYSRRIQPLLDGFAIPNIKLGDENLFLDGVHVARTDEPAEETYICIRPIKDDK